MALCFYFYYYCYYLRDRVRDRVRVRVGGTVATSVLPRVTVADILSGNKQGRGQYAGDGSGVERRSVVNPNPNPNPIPQGAIGKFLKRLVSKCIMKEPTYNEVVVVYFKRKRQSLSLDPYLHPMLQRTCNLRSMLRGGPWRWKGWRGKKDHSGSIDIDSTKGDYEHQDTPYRMPKGEGLGLQLRSYKGVSLVNLNAVTPDKVVEVRPQTALRLDLSSILGFGFVMANIRFDSPILVFAATASILFFLIRTVFGYLNTRIRVESFVSRELLNKSVGSNVPVLRYLAEEAAQQRARHTFLLYAALLQCVVEPGSRQNTSKAGASSTQGSPHTEGFEHGKPRVISKAEVARHCRHMVSDSLWPGRGSGELDQDFWLEEMERLEILVRVPSSDGNNLKRGDSQAILLAIEAGETLPPSSHGNNTLNTLEDKDSVTQTQGGVVFYRLLVPEAATEMLRQRWANLFEPKQDVDQGAPSATLPPWAVEQKTHDLPVEDSGGTVIPQAFATDEQGKVDLPWQ
ncbi:unnamed protein product [Choristocarpus tenellus]